MLKRLFLLLVILEVTVSCSGFGKIVHYTDGIGQPIYVGASPCALPCFYGIMPGETPDERALAYIASLPPEQQVTDYPARFFIDGVEGDPVEVNIPYTYGPYFDVVDRIELDTYDNSPILRLGQFIDAGWMPRHVYRVRASIAAVLLLVFGEHNQILAVVVDDKFIGADSLINMLYLLPAHNNENSRWDIHGGHAHFDDEILWLGYASAEDYWAAQPIN